MIAVDIFANAMGWDERDQARAQRSFSAVKALRTMRHAKAAPGPALYLDAALAVLDLIRAYADYRQAKEVTLQLTVEGEALKRLIQELHRQQGSACQLLAREATARQEHTRRQLAERTADVRLTEEQLLAFSRQAKTLGEAIARQRDSAPPRCPRLAALEEAYYQFMDLHLQLATRRLDARPVAEPAPSQKEAP